MQQHTLASDVVAPTNARSQCYNYLGSLPMFRDTVGPLVSRREHDTPGHESEVAGLLDGLGG
jgi:hypothetical protein